jgi:hypothetical protein
MGEAGKSIWGRFAFGSAWYLNGIIAATLIVASIPTFTSVDRFEALAALAAFSNWWFAISHQAAIWCNQFFVFWQLTAFDITSILFFFFFAIPTSIGIRRFDTEVFKLKYPKWIGFRVISYFAPALTLQVIFMSFLDPSVETDFERNYLAVFFAAILTGVGIWMLPVFFRAIVIVVSFLATLQALYVLNAPWFADLVRSWAY